MTNREVVEFNGVRFYRYPDSAQPTNRRYFRPGIANRQKGVKMLHQEIWMNSSGAIEIPAGYEVHHVDHDTSNNDPSNLKLMSAEEHRRHHQDCPSPASAEQLEHLERIRPLATEWHRSEEGRTWHRELAKKPKSHTTLTCAVCGRDYQAVYRGRSRFCSKSCKSKARRASGADNETRTCELCRKQFVVNRYLKTRFCGKSCAGRYSKGSK